jgi:serine/threonine protein kinase
VAKVLEDESIPESENTQTRGPSHAFSRSYAAPEQLAGGRTGTWTDIHALGLLLTELLTDRPPYPSFDPTELYELVFHADRPSPARWGVDVGPWQAIIERAVSLKPSQRFSDVATLAAALQETVDEATAAFAPRPARKLRVAYRAMRASPTDTTKSQETQTDTLSVVSSSRPHLGGSGLSVLRSHRTIAGLLALAAIGTGSYFVSRGLRPTPSASDASHVSAMATAPALDPQEATAVTPASSTASPATAAVAEMVDVPTKSPSVSSPKKVMPPPPASHRTPSTKVDPAPVAPSARPELPAYVVE